ncbi:MAG: prolipoprotein diacylglyceryl transferase [Candidatus Aminicenantales bacterium]
MFPILLRIGPITIHTYGFMMALGVGMALWFLYLQSRKQGLQPARIIDAAFYTIIISLIGAKLILFIGNFSYYLRYPRELFSLARSGGVFQGGLFFGFVFALWYFHRKKIPTWKVADIIGAALALGHGFGRIGCFTASCCYGRQSLAPWAVTFHSDYAHSITGVPLNTPLHPTQLYEAGLNFLNFFVLFMVLKRKKFDGQVFSLYIINYSLIRYFVEFFRGDHPEKYILIKGSSPFLSLSLPQLFCIIGLVAGIVLYAYMRKRKSA